MLMDHLREYNLKDLAGGVQYRLWGRTGAADDRLYLFWTGSSLEFNLRATELWVTLESSYMVFENYTGDASGRQKQPCNLFGQDGRRVRGSSAALAQAGVYR